MKNEIRWYMIPSSPNQLGLLHEEDSQQDQLKVNCQCLLHLEGT